MKKKSSGRLTSATDLHHAQCGNRRLSEKNARAVGVRALCERLVTDQLSCSLLELRETNPAVKSVAADAATWAASVSALAAALPNGAATPMSFKLKDLHLLT